MKKSQKVSVVHTPAQRFWGILAFAALFGCGVMLGIGLNEDKQQNVESAFSEWQCNELRSNIAQNNYPNVEVLEQMYEIYNENCAGRMFERPVVEELPEEPVPQKTCEMIEDSLEAYLPHADKYADSDIRIERAKIYAQLSERGCPENSEKYVALAKQELEIARALQDDKLDQEATVEVVETYKRLNMQAAAEEIIETAKKLTNPAIDFILEVEKVFNEK